MKLSSLRIRVLNLCTHFRCHSSLATNPLKPINSTELETLVLQQYKQGKFYNLIENVISKPTVLLASCRNLSNNESISEYYVSKRISIDEISDELRQNRFNVKECCVKMVANRIKGESFILPNLKMKVLIEAIRMVLEIVYDKRFATFAYGGRVGMGRHTAIRYLKTTVQDPSWWFKVSFKPHSVFDDKHVCRLCLIVEEKIDDKFLIELIKKFFEFEALRIELGGSCMGRGFPQESSLNSMLVNVYFDGFDKEMQEFRKKIDRKEKKLSVDSVGGRVFHKPERVYAVRYLDEILVITSSFSKRHVVGLKNEVVKFLEGVLEMEVDKLETAIHSSVSEKIDFLGMELQAVPPSVLHPRPSEKEIRARKKYNRQKEMKLLELKNARATRRRKRGLKIVEHVFKKVKRGDVFKFDYQIEREVREIFRSWGDETVQEFFQSLEDRADWHRKFTGGDFFTLRNIRSQLPCELVDAYDQFQEQVDKHLTPLKARNALEEVGKQVEEEEKKNYAESIVDDLTKLCMKVVAPPELIRKAVKLAGFTNSMGRPRPIKLLICLEDADIIKWYAGVGRRWLEYFCCCRNFKLVKTIVSYHMRFSCILTLAEKHGSTKLEAIRHYTKDLKTSDMAGGEEVYFPTEKEVKMMGDKNLTDPKPVDGALTMAVVRLAVDEPKSYCMAHFCDREETALYRIRLLQNRLNVDPINTEKWVPGMGAIHESLNRKCLSLCCDHLSDLYLGKITLQDIDCTAFVNV
ncbi:hypothetical protein C5167_025685 [Papaver somniferum]|uniref:Domain X domain-containing protein n=1 Tax=Papaver somniferum TaxID=3469 RepID=A0A4Y7JVZ3_PAPSO|nr:nuclear intron maturase 3, mitochondrial-like [Papaver somniferum]RZC63928.1 hypothetical protein C5167_025685 [Papaver somniferum]